VDAAPLAGDIALFRTTTPALEQSAAAADIEPSDEDFAVPDKLTQENPS